MGFNCRAIGNPQPAAGAIGGGWCGHRGTLQPVGSLAGGCDGKLHRGTHPRLARRTEHENRFCRPVGCAATHAEGRSICQQVGSLGRPHLRLRRGRPRAYSGCAPLVGRRNATDLVATCGEQRRLRRPLLRNSMVRP